MIAHLLRILLAYGLAVLFAGILAASSIYGLSRSGGRSFAEYLQYVAFGVYLVGLLSAGPALLFVAVAEIMPLRSWKPCALFGALTGLAQCCTNKGCKPARACITPSRACFR